MSLTAKGNLSPSLISDVSPAKIKDEIVIHMLPLILHAFQKSREIE